MTLLTHFMPSCKHKQSAVAFTMTEDLFRDQIVLSIEDDDTRKKLIAYGNAFNVDIAVCRSQEVANRAMKDGVGCCH